MMMTHLAALPARRAGVAVLLALGGCAAIPPVSDAAFGSSAEEVFRRQNRVFDELIAQTQSGREDVARLEAAELSLSHTCRYINEAALAMQNGQGVALSLKLKAMNTLSECDTAARQVWQLLGHAATEDPLAAPAY